MRKSIFNRKSVIKTKNLFLSIILLLSFGCDNMDDVSKDDNAANTNRNISLTSTQWKLAGFVDETDGTIQAIESECADCFLLSFNEDKTLTGKASAIEFTGIYDIDSTLFLQIDELDTLKVKETEEGKLFIRHLKTVRYSLLMGKDSLKLGKGTKEFLLFIPLDTITGKVDNPETPLVYPIEIEAIDFSLPEGCTWKHNTEQSVSVIRSAEDILPFIDGKFLENSIDFGKYSLLYARGQSTAGIDSIMKHLQQVSENEYLFYVDIMKNDATEVPLWNIALLVPKISEDARIELLVNYYPEKENISLSGTKWQLTAFVNVSEETTKTPILLDKPSKYGHYWIQFNEDNTCEGHSSSNLLLGRYSVSSVSSEVQITVGVATYMMELSPDGEEFIEKLNRIHSFVIKDSSLMLYYNETDYLLFDIYDNEKE
jgi:hypothetical protein